MKAAFGSSAIEQHVFDDRLQGHGRNPERLLLKSPIDVDGFRRIELLQLDV